MRSMIITSADNPMIKIMMSDITPPTTETESVLSLTLSVYDKPENKQMLTKWCKNSRQQGKRTKKKHTFSRCLPTQNKQCCG